VLYQLLKNITRLNEYKTMKSPHRILINLILASCSMLSIPTSADELKKDIRLNMGYYFNSISERANRTDIEISLNFWAKELFESEAKKHNFLISSSKAILFDRIEDMQNAFQQGELDLIVAPPLLISRYFKRSELGDGFVGMLEGKKPEALLLIARNDKDINGIKDLRGKRLELVEDDELADIFIDTLFLKELKKGYKNIDVAIERQKKSNRIILDVFFDKTDAGIIYSSSYTLMAELNPDIKNKIKPLAELPIKGRNFSFFRRDYPLIKELTSVAMRFPETVRGKQILEVFRTPEVINCKVEELDKFDNYYNEYLRLKKNTKK